MKLPAKFEHVFITTDLAGDININPTGKDQFAFITWGADGRNYLFELDHLALRTTTPNFVTMCLDSAERFGATSIGVEQGVLASVARPEFDRQMDRRGFGVALQSLKHGSISKAARAEAVIGRYQDRGFFFSPTSQDIQRQLCQFPKAERDDLADCVFYVPQMWRDFYLPFERPDGRVATFSPEGIEAMLDEIANPPGFRRQVRGTDCYGQTGFHPTMAKRGF